MLRCTQIEWVSIDPEEDNSFRWKFDPYVHLLLEDTLALYRE